jgi:hypothetical protein
MVKLAQDHNEKDLYVKLGEGSDGVRLFTVDSDGDCNECLLTLKNNGTIELAAGVGTHNGLVQTEKGYVKVTKETN